MADHQERDLQRMRVLAEDLSDLVLYGRMPFELDEVAGMGTVDQHRLVLEQAKERVAVLLGTDVEEENCWNAGSVGCVFGHGVARCLIRRPRAASRKLLLRHSPRLLKLGVTRKRISRLILLRQQQPLPGMC